MVKLHKIITNFVKFSKVHPYFYLGVASLISLVLVNDRFQQDFRLHQVKNGPETCTQRIYDLYATAASMGAAGIRQSAPFIKVTKECVSEILLTYDELFTHSNSKINTEQLIQLKTHLITYSKYLNDFLDSIGGYNDTNKHIIAQKLIVLTKQLDTIRSIFSSIKSQNFGQLPIYLGIVFSSLFLLTFFYFLSKKMNLYFEQLVATTEGQSQLLMNNLEKAGTGPIEDYFKSTLTSFKLFSTNQLLNELLKKVTLNAVLTPSPVYGAVKIHSPMKQKNKVELNNVLHTVAQELKNYIIGHNIKFNIHVAEDVFLSGDANMYHTVFYHLCKNVILSFDLSQTEVEKTITISAKKNAFSYIISISDTSSKNYFDETLYFKNNGKEIEFTTLGASMSLCKELMHYMDGQITIGQTLQLQVKSYTIEDSTKLVDLLVGKKSDIKSQLGIS